MKQRDLQSQYPDMGFEAFMNSIPRTDLFDQFYDLMLNDIDQITTEEAMYLHKGEVLLVRSKALPEEGDHFVLIVGAPVEKDHGIRPETVTYPATQNNILLDIFDKGDVNVVLLKLGTHAKEAFHRFNNITMNNGNVLLESKLIVS